MILLKKIYQHEIFHIPAYGNATRCIRWIRTSKRCFFWGFLATLFFKQSNNPGPLVNIAQSLPKVFPLAPFCRLYIVIKMAEFHANVTGHLRTPLICVLPQTFSLRMLSVTLHASRYFRYYLLLQHLYDL